jgi:hypothetical protein
LIVFDQEPDNQKRSTFVVNATSRLFAVREVTTGRPRLAVPKPQVVAAEDDLTPVAGVALWGPLLDRLNLIGVADELGVREIGPGGYSGGECYRSLVETLLAGGDFLSDVDLLRDEATAKLRGPHVLPSHDTLWRFCDQADLGRVSRAAAVNRVMLARAWEAGAAPSPGILTIDPDATKVATYGTTKQGSTFSYNYTGTCLHPIVGVFAETGEVCATRGRGGNANPGRALASFIDECIAAVPVHRRGDYQLWVRIDSAGYTEQVVETCERHDAWLSITAKKFTNVTGAIERLATDPSTRWKNAKGHERRLGSQIAETEFTFAGRTLRLIVRRQRAGVEGDAQLALDDVDGWRFHAIITNIPARMRNAVNIEAHHRLRGGVPEDAIRGLKEGFGFNHAPLSDFFGNWLWEQACAAAYNTSVWLRRLALPDTFARIRTKRLRLSLFNVPARVGTHARRLQLRFARHYRQAGDFAAALDRLHALPVFT